MGGAMGAWQLTCRQVSSGWGCGSGLGAPGLWASSASQNQGGSQGVRELAGAEVGRGGHSEQDGEGPGGGR